MLIGFLTHRSCACSHYWKIPFRSESFPKTKKHPRITFGIYRRWTLFVPAFEMRAYIDPLRGDQYTGSSQPQNWNDGDSACSRSFDLVMFNRGFVHEACLCPVICTLKLASSIAIICLWRGKWQHESTAVVGGLEHLLLVCGAGNLNLVPISFPERFLNKENCICFQARAC